MALATGNFTGLEAFFYANLNAIVFFVMTLSMIGTGAYFSQ